MRKDKRQKKKMRQNLPLSDVKDSGRSHHHGHETGLDSETGPGTPTSRKTCLGDMLKAPVPVVVVVRAKLRRAFSELAPRRPVKGHSHVVFARYPRRHFRLMRKFF